MEVELQPELVVDLPLRLELLVLLRVLEMWRFSRLVVSFVELVLVVSEWFCGLV